MTTLVPGRRWLAAVACGAALDAGCAVLPPLRATEPAQAIPGEPFAARDEQGGLRLTARPDDWRGWPPDVADHLTPVEVLVENRGERPVELAAGDVTLLLPGGRRLAPLPPEQLRDHLRSVGPGALQATDPAGLPELEPVQIRPRVPRRWRWWEEAWARPPTGPAAARTAPPVRLPPGRRQALLLFYPVPATRLETLAVELTAAGPDGAVLAGPRLAFARRPPGP